MALEDMSTDDISSAVTAALSDIYPSRDGDWDSGAWVRSLFPVKREVVFSTGGKTYRQSYSMDDSGKVTLLGSADEVLQVTTYEPVSMAAFAGVSARSEGEDLVYEGEIFRAGDYPDKGVKATKDHLKAIASKVTGTIQALVQHGRSPFDKTLKGYGLEKVEARDDGQWLWGRARLPKWIKDGIGEDLNVSVCLAKDGETPTDILELSLVDEGRVSSAILSQRLAAAFAGARHSKADQAALQDIHDLTVTQGATCKPDSADMGATHQPNDPASAPQAPAKEKLMTFIEKVKAYFGKADPKALEEAGITAEEIAAFEAPVVAPAEVKPVVSVETIDPALETRMAEFQKTIDRQNAQLLNTKAAEFADNVIRVQRRALPAAKDELIEFYKAAASADGNSGVANFADDGSVVPGVNMARLEKFIAALPQHAYFAEALPNAAVTDDTAGAHRAGIKESVLNGSPAGQKVLANKKGDK